MLGWLWRFARGSHVDVSGELRPGSRASALYLFLVLVFAVVAILLLALGFDLGDVDAWLDRQGGWLDALGTIAFRALLACVLLACTLMGGLALRGIGRRLAGRRAADDPGWGTLLLALVIGYFAAVGLVSKL